ncbi:hypothetical protein FVEN_g5745 [Fusarium venenatum]|uniref:2EXR domain-containing protein n=1 Tax=Fusarium venenatum TaxID=56646 RepID=A0A2L2TNQ5_9HYPO|nr:uncharacterized protein FVRRES_03883 [Fusarium venenatum]KAG8356492.1 hypothetical protein FVEN_g5745 [Fusarium venenatum]CEI67371.1 unnamed protein product [Fusarium venenatum]
MPRHKKQSKKPTSFHNFPKLPLEIQDEIWKFSLKNDVPAAHIVDIDHENTPRPRQHPAVLRMQRLIAMDCSSRMKPVYPAREALVQTCQHSRLIVEKIIKQWELYCHPTAQSWDYPGHYTYHGFHSKTKLIMAMPLQKVYTSRDLFIIADPWVGGELLFNLNRPSKSISVKYAAIPYLSSDESWEWAMSQGCRDMMDQIFRVFDHLQILYILIHPNEIRKGERFEVLSLLPAMKQHLNRYKRSRGETSPTTFQHGDRVYREISDVLLLKLSKLGGLPRAVTMLEQIAKEQRAKNGGDKPPLIIRFMTW